MFPQTIRGQLPPQCCGVISGDTFWDNSPPSVLWGGEFGVNGDGVMASESRSDAVHIRQKDNQGEALCGVPKPTASYSYQHLAIAYGDPDEVIVYDSHKQEISVDRRMAIRHGIESCPTPLCEYCTGLFWSEF